MSHLVQGGCLCGAVRFSGRLPTRDLAVCWCSQCMRQNSGPLISTNQAQDVTMTGDVATYRASDHASRGFCAACGSTLFWQEDGEAPSFAHGALDDRSGFRIVRFLHVDGRPDAYDIEANP
ncbi:GFA family protein [Paracoccus suum]|uniref:GFA family protein n=1 Tax=Paracoccus suum TaxID=2259340 RepID=A0A344PIP5_9RHOB|nr:GFA family protein [Paracoccus suum]AXC49250.1 GFA family protein [Paracoccus suum]